MHYHNSWPCVGRYIGRLEDNDNYICPWNEPRFAEFLCTEYIPIKIGE